MNAPTMLAHGYLFHKERAVRDPMTQELRPDISPLNIACPVCKVPVARVCVATPVCLP